MNFLVSSLYNSGTAKIIEDLIVISPPFFGVLDGVSGLYNPAIGPRLFGGKSGGQRAVEIVNEVFMSANYSDKLITLVKLANAKLRKFSELQGIDMHQADMLPGMAFVFAKIAEDEVEIIQGGDCYAVWKKIDGKIGITSNQNFFDEEEKITIFNDIIKKHNGNLDVAWAEYMPISARLRIERVNKNFKKRTVVLNGQPGGEDKWFKTILPRNKLKTLLLFTDGMIEFGESRNTEKIGKTILGIYYREGLTGILSRIREIEGKRTKISYINQVEATALAVDFQ